MRAPFFVTAATGTADLLAAELAALGIEGREVQGGVACEGGLADAYRACLESRIGMRVLWQLARFPAADAEGLYSGVRDIDWAAQLGADGTLAVDFSGSLPGVTHTQFGAQRIKDAIVDQFRERTGTRPSVDRESPALQIAERLAKRGVRLAYHDPLVPSVTLKAADAPLQSVATPDAGDYDLVLVVVVHPGHDHGFLDDAEHVLDATYRTPGGRVRHAV